MDPLDPDLGRAKEALREATRRARRELSPQERRERSEQACDRLLSLPEVRDADTVLAYAATDVEADPRAAVRALSQAGVRVLLPRVVGDRLELGAAGREGLVLGAFGVLEPVGPAVAPTVVDVAVLPGIAFDRTGGRLGQGGGHYDRLLPDLRVDALRIGFAFSVQMAVRVPREPHDELVDVVVTERAVHRMRQPPPTPA